jgi:uncharacterized caspase-like protein
MPTPARPEKTYALLVGIERYKAGKDWDLDGPASDARRFAAWLRKSGVPAANITALISPLERNAAVRSEIEDLIEKPAPEATAAAVRWALVDDLKTRSADLFLLFWGGHGWITPEGDRRLLYADATDDDRKNRTLIRSSPPCAPTYTEGFPSRYSSWTPAPTMS